MNSDGPQGGGPSLVVEGSNIATQQARPSSRSATSVRFCSEVERESRRNDGRNLRRRCDDPTVNSVGPQGGGPSVVVEGSNFVAQQARPSSRSARSVRFCSEVERASRDIDGRNLRRRYDDLTVNSVGPRGGGPSVVVEGSNIVAQQARPSSRSARSVRFCSGVERASRDIDGRDLRRRCDASPARSVLFPIVSTARAPQLTPLEVIGRRVPLAGLPMLTQPTSSELAATSLNNVETSHGERPPNGINTPAVLTSNLPLLRDEILADTTSSIRNHTIEHHSEPATRSTQSVAHPPGGMSNVVPISAPTRQRRPRTVFDEKRPTAAMDTPMG